MKTLVALLVALPMAGCDRPPPAAEEHEGTDAPAASPDPSPDLADPPGGMSLRLPEPGASREEVLAAHPECADEQALTEDGCRFHGWVHPLSQHCENGCTWWTYRFDDDALVSAELERGEWDVNAEYAARFTDEAHRVAREIERRLHAPPRVEVLGEWSEVEADDEGEARVLERRSWTLPDRRVVWSLSGAPGHHPGILLRVRQTPPGP